MFRRRQQLGAIAGWQLEAVSWLLAVGFHEQIPQLTVIGCFIDGHRQSESGDGTVGGTVRDSCSVTVSVLPTPHLMLLRR